MTAAVLSKSATGGASLSSTADSRGDFDNCKTMGPVLGVMFAGRVVHGGLQNRLAPSPRDRHGRETDKTNSGLRLVPSLEGRSDSPKQGVP